jgi:hypothetical protein
MRGVREEVEEARSQSNSTLPSSASAPIARAVSSENRTGATGPRISACVVCRNEADKLGPCLESVGWVDEILVMDLHSSDTSRIVAEGYGARVIAREPHPIVEPLRNELAALATGEWILALDPDERVTPGLSEELRRLSRRVDLDAVVIPRMNWDLGYPPSSPIQRYEPQLRMYRRLRVQWPVVPNALPSVPEERLYRLPQRDDLVLVHDRSRNVTEVLDRIVRYGPAQAQSMLDQGQVFTARAMLLALAQQVDKEFFRARAWQDGVPGLLRAGILVSFKFYVWAAFWQLCGARRSAEDDHLLQRVGAVAEAVRTLVRGGSVGYRTIRKLSRR